MSVDALNAVIRRAILDFMNEIGGEQSDDTLTLLLKQRGHPVARRTVVEQMRWLADAGLIAAEEVEPFLLAQILPDGEDVANGHFFYDGVHRHAVRRKVGTAR